MSRIPLPYAPKVLELFQNPQNLGRMEDATVAASAGSPACGDMIAFYLKIEDKSEIITKSSFESYGRTWWFRHVSLSLSKCVKCTGV